MGDHRGFLPVKPDRTYIFNVTVSLISLLLMSLFDTTQELKNRFLSVTLTFNMHNGTLRTWELNLTIQKGYSLPLTDLLECCEC